MPKLNQEGVDPALSELQLLSPISSLFIDSIQRGQRVLWDFSFSVNIKDVLPGPSGIFHVLFVNF